MKAILHNMGLLFWVPYQQKFNKLFNAQNTIMRVLFGDRKKIIDKFRTFHIQARTYPEQNLHTEFMS